MYGRREQKVWGWRGKDMGVGVKVKDSERGGWGGEGRVGDVWGGGIKGREANEELELWRAGKGGVGGEGLGGGGNGDKEEEEEGEGKKANKIKRKERRRKL